MLKKLINEQMDERKEETHQLLKEYGLKYTELYDSSVTETTWEEELEKIKKLSGLNRNARTHFLAKLLNREFKRALNKNSGKLELLDKSVFVSKNGTKSKHIRAYPESLMKNWYFVVSPSGGIIFWYQVRTAIKEMLSSSDSELVDYQNFLRGRMTKAQRLKSAFSKEKALLVYDELLIEELKQIEQEIIKGVAFKRVKRKIKERYKKDLEYQVKIFEKENLQKV